MKRYLKAIITIILLAFCFNTTVSAADSNLYESPELNQNIDLVFSVAKDIVIDHTTNGIYYDPKPYGDYWQIHENINHSGNNGRYTIHNVSGSAISVGIQNYLGEGDIRNVNETYLEQDDVVENILTNYAGIDYEYVSNLAAQYISAHRDDVAFEGYCELWGIDFFVLKYQRDSYNPSKGDYGRIHVDGKVVFYEIEEPTEEPIEEEPTPIEESIPEEEEPTPIEEKPIIEDDPVVEEEVEETPTPSPIVRIIIPPIIISTPTPTPTLVPTPTPTPEPTTTPVPTAVPTPTPVEEEIEVDIVETPEGAPEEEVEVEPVDVPEGIPEEEIPIDLPDVPEGDVLPQTGVADSLVFFLFGGWMIALGALLIKRTKI